MSRLTAFFIFFGVVFGTSIVPVEAAEALTCDQKRVLIAGALSRGDIAAAASYQRMSCSSGQSTSTTLTCTQRSLNIANALTRGDVANAAYWQAAACTGSSGGSSGGSSSGSGNTAPRCSTPPNSPGVTYKWTPTGIQITMTPDASGQVVDRLIYTYSIFNLSSGWSNWSDWILASSASPTLFEYVAKSSDETKIAFGTAQGNTCGSSAQVRLDTDQTGIRIFNPTYDEVIQTVKSAVQGEPTSIATVLQTTSGNPGAVSVLTPRICEVQGGNIIGLRRGACRLEVSTTTSSDMLGTMRTLSIAIAPSGRSITCVKDNNKRKKLTVSGQKPTCPQGYSRR